MIQNRIRQGAYDLNCYVSTYNLIKTEGVILQRKFDIQKVKDEYNEIFHSPPITKLPRVPKCKPPTEVIKKFLKIYRGTHL